MLNVCENVHTKKEIKMIIIIYYFSDYFSQVNKAFVEIFYTDLWKTHFKFDKGSDTSFKVLTFYSCFVKVWKLCLRP